MSRSRKRTPKIGFSGSVSEKEDKQLYARAVRHSAKIATRKGDEAVPPDHARSGTWKFAKDGKRWVAKPRSKDMRK